MGMKPGSNKAKPLLNSTAVGSCVRCARGIFSHQPHGRAPKPLLGLAHESAQDCPALAEVGS